MVEGEGMSNEGGGFSLTETLYFKDVHCYGYI